MKPYSEIAIEVKNLIATTLGQHIDTIDESLAISDLSQDSIKLFELLLAFEKQYAIETSYEDVLNLNTVADITKYVERVKYMH